MVWIYKCKEVTIQIWILSKWWPGFGRHTFSSTWNEETHQESSLRKEAWGRRGSHRDGLVGVGSECSPWQYFRLWWGGAGGQMSGGRHATPSYHLRQVTNSFYILVLCHKKGLFFSAFTHPSSSGKSLTRSMKLLRSTMLTMPILIARAQNTTWSGHTD